jgi:hypothetical protein
MSRKPYRFGLLIIGLLVTAGLGYRAVEVETSLGRASREAVAHDRAAGQALEALLTLQASLHAYVAPGQGVPYWSQRAEQTLDRLREELVALDTAMAAHRGSLADTLDAVDQLAAAERRSREYARRGETLLAGDVVFTETRGLMSAAIEQVQTARNTLAGIDDARVSALRREQAMLAEGVIAAWALIAALLVPPVKEVAVKDPHAWRTDLAETIKKPIPKEPEHAAARTKPLEPVEPLEPLEPLVAAKPPLPALSLEALQRVSEVCSDLSTLTDAGALTGALDRAAVALEASGMIVWVAANDGNSLAPVASHGFDEKLVSRIGRLPRESANLTAAAYRDNIPRVSAATADAPAALAVTLCGPTGAVGVLSVELKPNVAADEARVALATIFAAQLATLAQPMPQPSTTPAPIREGSADTDRDLAGSSAVASAKVEAAFGRDGGPSPQAVEQPKRAAL